MPPIGITSYPSLTQVANLVRTFVDDDKRGLTGTPGEGQILTNPQYDDSGTLIPGTNKSTTLPTLMNSAIREIYREIRIMGQPTLYGDNYILYSLPPVNSPLGAGVANPAIQVALQFTGYFDGIQVWPNFTLPNNMLYPLEVWQRPSGTNYPFSLVPQATGALRPCNQQMSLGEWEWRSDGIWFNGSTLPMDIRIRWEFTFVDLASPNIDWDDTYIPILDSQEAVADAISVRYARRLGGATLEDAKQQAKKSVFQLRQQITRSRQGINNVRPIFKSGHNGKNDFGRAMY
jgi:hypothetical protein